MCYILSLARLCVLFCSVFSEGKFKAHGTGREKRVADEMYFLLLRKDRGQSVCH